MVEDSLFDFISKYAPLTEEEKKAITSLGIFHAFPRNTILLRRGDRSKDGYFVLKGCIRVYYIVDGEEKTTAFFTKNEGHTPLCVTSGGPSEYYISCVEDSIVTISNPDMETLIFEKFPKFETVCRLLSEELLANSQLNLDVFKTSSPEQRYLMLLENRPDLLQRVPQHQLASFIGITPPSLSRLRARINRSARSSK